MGQARPVHNTGPSDDVAKHMRGGPHPGMRAAAEMQKQASQGGGGGKGMMGVVLPMYAIGIVVYLVYTLSKIFGNKKKDPDSKSNEERMRQINKGLSEVRYDADRKKFMYGEEDSEGETDDFHNFRQSRRQQRDLEKLLYKADKEKISDLEMRELKRRLLETESQMTRILSAMETVTENVQVQRGGLRDEEYEYEQDQYEEENRNPPKKSRAKRPPKQQLNSENNIRQRNVKPNVRSRIPRDEEIERKPRRRIVKNRKPEKDKNEDAMDENEYSEVQDKMKRKGKEKQNFHQDDEYSDDFEDQEKESAAGENYGVEDLGPQEQNYQTREEEFVENYPDEDEESIPEEIHADDSEGSEDYGDSDIDRGMQESQFTQKPSAVRGNHADDDYEEEYEYQNEADDLEQEEEVSSEGEGYDEYVIEDDSEEEHDDEHSDLRKRVLKKGNDSQD